MPPPQRPPQPLVANAPATTVPSPQPPRRHARPRPASAYRQPSSQLSSHGPGLALRARERAPLSNDRPKRARPSPAISSQVMRRRVGVATAWRDELSSVPEQMLGLKRAWLDAMSESASAD